MKTTTRVPPPFTKMVKSLSQTELEFALSDRHYNQNVSARAPSYGRNKVDETAAGLSIRRHGLPPHELVAAQVVVQRA